MKIIPLLIIWFQISLVVGLIFSFINEFLSPFSMFIVTIAFIPEFMKAFEEEEKS